MTNKKSALDAALEAEQAHQEKLTLKWLLIRKTMNRGDHLDAVEALGPQDEWTELDMKIVSARKVSGKSWDELFTLAEQDIDGLIIG